MQALCVYNHIVHIRVMFESHVCMQVCTYMQCIKQDWCPSGTALHLFSDLNVCTAQAVLDKYTPGAAAEALSLPLKRLQFELLCHVALDPCFSCNTYSEKKPCISMYT